MPVVRRSRILRSLCLRGTHAVRPAFDWIGLEMRLVHSNAGVRGFARKACARSSRTARFALD